jgi:hypothetical protein
MGEDCMCDECQESLDEPQICMGCDTTRHPPQSFTECALQCGRYACDQCVFNNNQADLCTNCETCGQCSRLLQCGKCSSRGCVPVGEMSCNMHECLKCGKGTCKTCVPREGSPACSHCREPLFSKKRKKPSKTELQDKQRCMACNRETSKIRCALKECRNKCGKCVCDKCFKDNQADMCACCETCGDCSRLLQCGNCSIQGCVGEGKDCNMYECLKCGDGTCKGCVNSLCRCW